MSKTERDPREIVTPDAFRIDPGLLGHPLATPGRRLAAILLDLIIAVLLSQLGGIILGSITAVIFFLIAVRNRNDHMLGKSWRWASAGIAALVVFAVVISLVNDHTDESVNGKTLTKEQAAKINWSSYLHRAINISKEDSIPTDQAIEKLADNLEKDIRKAAGDSLNPPVIPSNGPEILQSYAVAMQRNDAKVMDSLRDDAANIVAGVELTKLRSQNMRLATRLDQKEKENAMLKNKADHPGILTFIKSQADDLGLTAGWFGIYFTICLVWLDGQTPGKRLMKLKVVQLNGIPITLWSSFGRFGGYAAGFATGMLGFVQVYWDPNRQAIHDKISGTVVLDVRTKVKQHYHYVHEKSTNQVEEG